MNIEKLKLIKEVVGEAIEAAQQSEIQGPINWGDLSCVEVSYCLSDDGQESYIALIEEADPINDEFRAFIANYMLTQSKVQIDRELVIKTERNRKWGTARESGEGNPTAASD